MKNLFFGGIAALIFASCSNNDEMKLPSSQEWNGEILLSTPLSRTSSKLDVDKSVAIYVNNASDDSQLYGKTVFTVGADGKLVKPGETEFKYPENGNVDIWGFTELTDALSEDMDTDWTIAKILQIETNNLKDYVLAKIEDQPKSSTYLTLQFNHILAKVRVAVAKGMGDFTDASIASFSSVIKSGSIDLSTMAVTVSENTGFSSTENNLNDNLDSEALKYYEALVLPQDYSASSVDLFSVTIGGDTYTYNATENFQAGKVYTYNLEINNEGKSLELKSVNISDWDNADGQTGSITIPNE